MNTAPLTLALLVIALALAPRAMRAAGKPATAAQEAPPPRSEFVIDPQFGRDPFFPKSTRMQGRAPVPVNVPTTPQTSFPDEIRVQGVSTQRDRIIVILNGKSIEKGEKIELPIRGQRIAVRCLDVKERTILLEVNGITKELPLPVNTSATPQ